jgi:predicted nuclease of predicted toxin-antitoxin system
LRVLLDKNVPYGVRRFLSDHSVETVDDRGWQQISNGELLAAAELAGFEVVVTADQNIV